VINIETFRSKLSEHFTNPRIIGQDVLRCEENDAQGRLFALHYFAMTKDLAQAANNLAEFQDEVLGNTYYETQGDLRWSHYLYFIIDEGVLTSPEALKEKVRIEANQSYARKFVLTNQQFIYNLAQRELSVSASENGTENDIINRWTSRLMDGNLDVVLKQKGLAETVRAIGYGSQVKHTRPASVQPTSRAHPLAKSFISKLEISSFRDYLIDRTFDELGKVNLIVGGNGTGKTSILESIEYLFCSDNARIPTTQPVSIRAYVVDQSQSVEIRPSTSLNELKSRNLTWYGTRDLRRSTLANSFARYNFLSTDEAALLAQDPSVDLDDLLSRIVAGPKAADLWGHITKLIAPLDTEISKTESSLMRWEAEKRTAQEQIKNAIASPSQADHAFSALSEDLRRLKWKSTFDKNSIDFTVLPNLQIAYSLTREILDAERAETTVIPQAIRQQAKEQLHRVTAFRNFVSKISDEKKTIVQLEMTLQKCAQSLSLIDEVGKVVASGVLDVIRDIEDGEVKLANEQKLITKPSLFNVAQDLIVAKSAEIPVDEELNSFTEKEQQLFVEINNINNNLDALRLTKSKNQILLQDIRRLARKLAEHQHGMSHCPVCQTEFDAIELRRRIEKSVQSTTDEAFEVLVKHLEGLKTEHSNCKGRRAQLEDATLYAKAQGLDTSSISFSNIIENISAVRARILAIQKKSERSCEQLSALAESGFSKQKVLEIIDKAKIADINVLARPNLAKTRLAIESECTSMEKRLSEARRSLDDLKQKSASLFQTSKASMEMASIVTEEKMLSLTEKQYCLLQLAVNNIDQVNEVLNIDEETSITGIITLIGSAIAVAEKYIAASANEQRLVGIEQKARQRLTGAETGILTDNTTLKKLRHALDILNNIRKNYSLTKATEDDLESISKVTAAIFGNIHSPREYGVRRGLQRPLFRLDTNKAVSLKEISTGQRAAFVLSLFLAMNAKLRNAPKVILLDDPIAHIDDLNSLSFLDHLRHLVLTGRRQVFYATADTRLAGLIEHKFGFLGHDFKRIDLVR
jgi:exonuclease SbcC